MAVFVFIESKRLNLLINGLHTGTEEHILVQDKVMCKDTSNHAGTAPNRRGGKRSYVHEQGERTETRQQNIHKHTPNKKLKAL